MNGPLYGRFRVTQKYKGVSHKGMDLVGGDSKEIHATADGVVEAARWDVKPGTTEMDTGYGMGQYVRIRENGTGFRYYFCPHVGDTDICR